MEGIYIAYVTGTAGHSAVMFTAKNGKIVGADLGGVRYNGNYAMKMEGFAGILQAYFPPNSVSVGGGRIGPDGAYFDIPFEIKDAAADQQTLHLNTQLGAVTANLVRLGDTL